MSIGSENRWAKPDPKDLVMHVRLGDVLDPKNPIGPERIFHYYGSFFAQLTNKPLNTPRLIICTALHYCDYGGLYDHDIISEVNSRQLLSNILYEGNSRSMKIDVYSNTNPDMDFYYLCNSKNLVLSISDYSAIAAGIIKEKNITANIIPFVYNLHLRQKANVNWSDAIKKEKEVLGID